MHTILTLDYEKAKDLHYILATPTACDINNQVVVLVSVYFITVWDKIHGTISMTLPSIISNCCQQSTFIINITNIISTVAGYSCRRRRWRIMHNSQYLLLTWVPTSIFHIPHQWFGCTRQTVVVNFITVWDKIHRTINDITIYKQHLQISQASTVAGCNYMRRQ